jgi:hypothetical protein
MVPVTIEELYGDGFLAVEAVAVRGVLASLPAGEVLGVPPPIPEPECTATAQIGRPEQVPKSSASAPSRNPLPA